MSDGFEWLDWLEPSGPFLAPPVLKSAFPQGLGTLDPSKRKALRQAYDEYREALEGEDPESDKFHAAWVDLVLRQGLEYDEDESGDNLKSAADLPDSLAIQVAEHGVILKPNYAVVDDQDDDKPMMLIQVYDADVDLNDAVHGDGWASSPRDRMVRLCRDTGTRLGLVTNGEHWLFVDAPVSAVSSFANWYARLWGPEPVLLQAFVVLLAVRRFFLAADEQLPALIDRSVEYQDEVTEALGEQVRRAVEVLIQALDKADVDRNRELLKDVDPRELYEAGLTVMMRLVFLLSAEERELLLLGDERYEANYAVSTLRMQLRGEDDSILQRRWDAWSRLLAIFRAIYGGIEHETLRMPALGGSLFDPDRFPFLEGRDKESNWKSDPAKPLPIDNQTVLLLLDAIQLFEGRTLSYRGLDIEQLGYVYEGLLDHTVKRAHEVTLELDGTKSAKRPWVTLGELESARLDGDKAVEALLKERTGSSISRVRNDLKREVNPQQSMSLLTASHNDQALHDQLKQYFHLIRTDSWGRPLVYPEGSFMVTTGEDRRQTGSHYTPTSLTEAIVRETLEPVVYVGPAEGKPRAEWQLMSAEELLDLKICDPAMGSGAFLVQVCRWLGDRVNEAWSQAEQTGKQVDINGLVVDNFDCSEPMPIDAEERSVNARRLIAERCIYGVDLNPLAVELAKLSIWLVTLAEGRPFGFLDHNLKCGDSLVGIHRLDQLTELRISPDGKGQQQLFGKNIEQAVLDAIEFRQRLRDIPIRDIHDVEAMAHLDANARQRLQVPEIIGDALIGEAFAAGNSETVLENCLTSLSVQAEQALNGDEDAIRAIAARSVSKLSIDLTPDKRRRQPFHWPIEFPEVFASPRTGFSAIIGNPPFLGGRRISFRHSKELLVFLKSWLDGAAGTTDLCVYFLLRASLLTETHGYVGLILSDIVSQGESRVNGLERLISEGLSIISCVSSMQWPGLAGVKISQVHLAKSSWAGLVNLNGIISDGVITSYLQLSDGQVELPPQKLASNTDLCFSGHYLMGRGFVLSETEKASLIKSNPKNSDVIFPYIRGDDINNEPTQASGLCAINFSMRELSECEEKFPGCLAIVRKRVKPERDVVKRKANRERWWRYAEARPGLEAKIARLSTVLVQPFTAKYLFPTFVNAKSVFAHPLVVIVEPDFHVYACLQSSIHEKWVWQHCSTSLELLRYTASSVLSTFPFPGGSDSIRKSGETYYRCRQDLLSSQNVGLTKIYNRFHDPHDVAPEIQELRELHCGLDRAVRDGYGWAEVELGHDFHETNQGIRFTISEDAKRRLLRRLSELNHSRFEEEAAQGLHRDQKAKDHSKEKKGDGGVRNGQVGLDFGSKLS